MNLAIHHLLAYVGPGPGLTMFWAFIALLGTIGLSVLYLLSWPLRLLIRRARGSAPNDSRPPENDPDQPDKPPTKRE